MLVRGPYPHDNIHQKYYNFKTGILTYFLKALEFHLPIDWILSSVIPNIAAAVVAAPIRKLWLLYLWLSRLAHVRDSLSWSEKNWREMDDPSINENSAVFMFVCFLIF